MSRCGECRGVGGLGMVLKIWGVVVINCYACVMDQVQCSDNWWFLGRGTGDFHCTWCRARCRGVHALFPRYQCVFFVFNMHLHKRIGNVDHSDIHLLSSALMTQVNRADSAATVSKLASSLQMQWRCLFPPATVLAFVFPQ